MALTFDDAKEWVKTVGAIVSFGLIVWEAVIKKIYRGRQSLKQETALMKNTDVDLEIKKRLAFLIARFYFNRATAQAYSNGQKSASGESFKKVSITHEEVDNNTAGIMHIYQQYPTSGFADIMKLLMDSPDGWVKIDTNDPLTSPAIKKTLRQHGVKLLFQFRAGKFLSEGVVSLVYLHREDIKVDITEEDILMMQAVAYQIGDLKKNNKPKGLIATFMLLFKKKNP